MKKCTVHAHKRKGRYVRQHARKVKKGSSFTSGQMRGGYEKQLDDMERSRQYVDMKDRYLLAEQLKGMRPIKKSAFGLFGGGDKDPKNYIDDFGKHYVFPSAQAAAKFADSTGGALQQVKKKDKVITEVILP